MEINYFSQDISKKLKKETVVLPIFAGEMRKDPLFKKLDQLLNNVLSKKAKNFAFIGKSGEIFSVDDVFVFGLGKRGDFSLSRFAGLLGQVLRRAASQKIASLALAVTGDLGNDSFYLGKAIAEALYLSQYRFDKHKSEEERRKMGRVEELNIYLEKAQSSKLKVQNKSKVQNPKQFIKELERGIELGKIISEGVYLARDLVNEPASHVHPESLVQEAFKIEKESKGKIKVEVLDEEECRRLGMGAFLAVAQGSERKLKFITMHYREDLSCHSGERQRLQNLVDSGQARMTKKKICLIGKSITFDSGGLSLKPAEAMETMKIDMAGGAAVLGIFKALMKLSEVPFEIYGLLPACENMPSGKALRPGDVVSSVNEKTIEVVNTDAEGRLTLADALAYAEKYLKPDYIIDLATLTGAIMGALGEEMTGLFGNDQRFTAQIKKAAEEESEALWEMPLYDAYLKKMKSDIADLKNVSGTRYGGAITAALFLKEFVKTAKWIHLDIAGSSYNSGEAKGIVPKGGTGWGVRTIIKFLI